LFRAGLAMREVSLLLGGLAENSIHSLVARPFYGSWVSLPGQAPQAAYLYPYYPSLVTSSSGDFAVPGALAPLMPSHDLFGVFGGVAGQPLSIPTELAETVDRYRVLDLEHREQVLRSCYWLQRARRSFLDSFPQSFLAVGTVAERRRRSRNGSERRSTIDGRPLGCFPVQSVCGCRHLSNVARLQEATDLNLLDKLALALFWLAPAPSGTYTNHSL
jgi:hypothetical protein